MPKKVQELHETKKDLEERDRAYRARSFKDQTKELGNLKKDLGKRTRTDQARSFKDQNK